MLKFRLLGTFEIIRGERPVDINSRIAQSLLAFLLINSQTKYRRENLAGLFWPDVPENNARTNLRQLLWQLRKVIGVDFVSADKLHVFLNPKARYELDAKQLAQMQDTSISLTERLSVLERVQGELLPGFYDDWVTPERERLARIFNAQMELALEGLQNEGRWREALTWAERWLAYRKGIEAAYRYLMRAHAALGDTASAKAVYQRCVDDLSNELGVPPSAETQELLANVTGFTWVAPGRSPYRGLFAFREEDASLFFGREFFVSRFAEKVKQSAAVVLNGSSGIGKTSVLFAGLIPVFKADDWKILALRPGNDPFLELKALLIPSGGDKSHKASNAQGSKHNNVIGAVQLVDALRGKSKNRTKLLVIIDQFEELFTLCTDEVIRKGFLKLIYDLLLIAKTERRGRFALVLGIRADFLGKLFEWRPLADEVESSILNLGPMNAEELHRAVRNPAEKGGARFEPGLVERIIDDLGDSPSLPLLEFALTELWEKRRNQILSHKDYESIGKVKGALAVYAERTYRSLSLREQEQVRAIFVQLVQPGDQSPDTKRMATRKELGDAHWPLALQLADQRLLIAGRDSRDQEVIELVHETLMTEWDRLRYWIESDREFRSWQERLRIDLFQWEKNNHNDGALLHGTSLDEALQWKERATASLSEAELQYIQASQDYAHAKLEQASIKQWEQERDRRRAIVALAAGLVFTTAFAIFAGFSWQKAQAEENQARQAYSLSLAANAQHLFQLKDNVSALALAFAATALDNPPLAAQEVLRSIAFSPGPRKYYPLNEVLTDETVIPVSVAISPDSKTAVVSAFTDGRLALIDLETGELLREFTGHTRLSNELAFSPNGAHAISASDDGKLILWDVETGEIIHDMTGHSGSVSAVAISPDGSTALSAGLQGAENILESLQLPGELILWDLETGREIRRFTGGHAQLVLDVVYSPDGQYALSSSGLRKASDIIQPDSGLILWDLSTGEILNPFDKLNTENPTGVAMSPDGLSILVGSMEGTLYWLDSKTGELIYAFRDHSNWISDVAFSPDGRFAIAGLGDGQAVIWDLASKQQVAALKFHSKELTDFAVSPDGETMISVSSDGGMVLWGLTNVSEQRRFLVGSSTISELLILPDGERFLAGSIDGFLRLVDSQTGKIERTIRTDGQINAMDISPDGNHVLTGLVDGRLILWNLKDGKAVRELFGHKGPVNAVAFSTVANTAYSASEDKSIIQWDISSGEIIGILNGHVLPISSLAINSNGTKMVSGSQDGIILWDLVSGQQIHSSFAPQFNVTSLDFSPDDASILGALGFFGNNVSAWDSANGQENLRIEELGPILDVSISPDSKFGVYAVGDGSVVLLNFATGERVIRYQGHKSDGVNTVAFSPDSKTVYSAGENGAVIQWAVPDPTLSSLQEWIKDNRFVRELTCLERQNYQVEPICSPDVAQSDQMENGSLNVPDRQEKVTTLGENRGEIRAGDFEIWLYEGKAGDLISIYMNADKPGTRIQSPEEKLALSLLDTALVVIAPDGSLIAASHFDELSSSLSTDAAIRNLELPVDGIYRIEARSYGGFTSGPYTLIIEQQ